MMHLFLALGLARGLLCSAEPLRFNSEGVFKIAIFTDLHYGESPDLDLKSDEVQRMVLAKEQPDFIVFNGDMVSGWKAIQEKSGWFQNRWRQLTAPAREFSVPFSIILGNHDDEGNLDRRQILQHDIDTSDGLSYTQQGPIRVGGASNYFLDIFPHPTTAPAASSSTTTTTTTTLKLQPNVETARNVSEFSIKVNPLLLTPAEPDPAARLWFFDSMNRGCLNENNAWGCIAPTAIQWASTVSKTIPIVQTAMAFVHIPIPEAVNVWEESAGPVYGSKREFSNCQGQNTGLHQFAKENGVQAVWSGHDHVNDYNGVWDGVRVGYGRKTGYGSYFYGNTIVGGDASSSSIVVPVQRGARIIELRQGESAINAKTWIALESGTREYQKVVNKMLSGGPPEQTVCRSGAVTAFPKSGLWWLQLLVIVILAVLFT